MTGTVAPTLPTAGSPNSTEDPKVKGSLETLRDALNAILGSSNKVEAFEEAKIEDKHLKSPNNGLYRSIFSVGSKFDTEAAAATYFLVNSNSLITSAANPQILPYFYFDDADYLATSKTLKMRLRVQVATNATKPTIKFTFGVYPITVAGGASVINFTPGSVVSGSTVEFNEPAASTITQKEAADFTIPSDGAYALCVVTSAKLTANSVCMASAQLQVRNV